MTLSLSSSSPSNGSVDFYTNKSIELVFNKAISSVALSESPIILMDMGAGNSVPITLSLNPLDTTVVVVSPKVVLKENTQYKLIIVGSDLDYGYYLYAADSDILTVTLQVVFTTGDNLYQIDPVVEKEAASITLEGDLFLPTNVKALGYDFTVEKVRPLNHLHGVDVNLTGDRTIRFTFSKALYTGLDLDSCIEVDAYPILDSTDYLASGTTMNLGVNTEIAIPSHTLSINQDQLVVTFGGELPKNTGISILLTNNIKSVDNDTYGGDMQYVINTELFPSLDMIRTIKREIRPVVVSFYDDFIGALVLKNAIWLWEQTGRSFNLASVSRVIYNHVYYSTALDLIEDKDLERTLLSGSRRQLADLNVSFDNLIGRLALKTVRLQKAKDICFETLFKGWQVSTGVIAAYASAAESVNRLWYNVSNVYTDPNYKYLQLNEPTSNTVLNRAAKTNNPGWL